MLYQYGSTIKTTTMIGAKTITSITAIINTSATATTTCNGGGSDMNFATRKFWPMNGVTHKEYAFEHVQHICFTSLLIHVNTTI